MKPHAERRPGKESRRGWLSGWRGAATALGVVCLAVSGGVCHAETLGASVPENVPGTAAVETVNPEALIAEIPVITPTKVLTPELLSPTTVHVITRRELELGGYETVGAALGRLDADVQQIEGGVDSFFSIRGYSSSSDFNERTLILLDGQPLNDPVIGTFDLNSIPTNNIDHIEIAAGPGSALYGPNAFAGVINIITREPGDIHQDLGELAAGSGEVAVGGVIAAPGKGNNGGRGGARWSLSGLYNRDPGLASTANGNGETASVRAEIVPRDRLKLALGFYGSDEGAVGDSFGSPPTPHNRLRSNLGTATASWKPLTGRADTTVRFYSEFGSEQARSEIMGPPGVSTGQFSFLNANDAIYGLDAQSQLPRGRWGSALLGIDLRENESSGDIAAHADNLAGFIEDQLHWGRLTPSLGVRYDYHSIYGGRLSPRAAALYQLSPRYTLRASIGSAYRAPSLLELFVPRYVLNREIPTPPFVIPITITGNPKLRPEDTTASEIGFRGEISRDLNLDAAVFVDQVSSLITFVVPPPAPGRLPTGTWANSESGSIRGFETTIEKALRRDLHTSLQYTYLDASQVTLNNPAALALPAVAPHHQLTWETYLYNFHKMDAELTVNARSAAPVRGGAVLADLTVGRGLTSHLGVQVALRNLFNSDYAVGDAIPGSGRMASVRLVGTL